MSNLERDVPALPEDVKVLGFRKREDWLKEREVGVGASEVASLFAQEIAAVGDAPPFKSAFQLYAEKVGILPPPPSTQRMRLGLWFEAGIVGEFREATGLEVAPSGPDEFNLYRNEKDAPGLFATPDRFVRLPEGWGVLEVKLTGKKWDELPLRYVLQVQAQMAVLGLPLGMVAACVASRELLPPFPLRADSELAGMIAARVAIFLRLVAEKSPPEVTAPDNEVMRRLYPEHVPGKVISLPPDADTIADRLAIVKSEISTREEFVDGCEARLKALMGDAETGKLPSGGVVTWKATKRKAYEVKESTVRTLRVRPREEGK